MAASHHVAPAVIARERARADRLRGWRKERVTVHTRLSGIFSCRRGRRCGPRRPRRCRRDVLVRFVRRVVSRCRDSGESKRIGRERVLGNF